MLVLPHPLPRIVGTGAGGIAAILHETSGIPPLRLSLLGAPLATPLALSLRALALTLTLALALLSLRALALTLALPLLALSLLILTLLVLSLLVPSLLVLSLLVLTLLVLSLLALTLLALHILQPALYGLRALDRVTQFVQSILLFLLVGVIGRGCRLSDLFLNVVETLFDGALELRGIVEVAILRSRVIENLPALFDAVLELLALDGIRSGSSLVGGVLVFLIVAQRFQLVGHRLQFLADAILLLVDFLSAAPRIGR